MRFSLLVPKYKEVDIRKYCKKCKKKLSYSNKSGFCKECFIKKQNKEKIDRWLKTGDIGIATTTTLRSCIRDYIYKTQDNRCKICGMERVWNNKKINFILDHIDGNANNNSFSNLRLICSNCDSQLPTYKSRNKKSARNYRRVGRR